jgi:hypothetical protein
MTVTVTVDDKAKQALDAQFGPQVGTGITNKILGDAKFAVNASRDTQGKYTFRISSPVIVARLIKKQPAAGTLGASDSWSGPWKSPNVMPTWPGAHQP